MEKKCAHCSMIFLASKFCADRVRYCSKKCAAAARRNNPEYRKAQAEFRAKNAEKAKEYMKVWRAKNSARLAEYVERHREANRKRTLAIYYKNHEKNKLRAKLGRKVRLYGVTQEMYQQMMERQGSACAICKLPPRDGRPLCIDHCHTSGRVRGLLCDKCNTRLQALEDWNYRTAAEEYLRTHSTPEDRITKVTSPTEFK